MTRRIEGLGFSGSPDVTPKRGVRFRATTSEPKNGGSQERVDRHAQIERIRDVRREDIATILEWAANPEVRKHLVPAPKIPTDWGNESQKGQAIDEYVKYLNNDGEPGKITPALAVNKQDKPLAVAVIRWRGDPYVPTTRGIASLEGLMVDPKHQGKLVGTTFVATLIEVMFYTYKGYVGSGAREIRGWIMTDRQASPWERNFDFFRRLGFQAAPTEKHWAEYARDRGIEDKLAEEERGRDALWLRLLPEWYNRAKQEHSTTIKPCRSLDLNLLRTKTI